MKDCHYDLLTYIFINRDNLERVKEDCNKIFKSGIDGGIFNLFYMSIEEMQEELSIQTEKINIIENLKTVKNLIKQEALIPENIDYIIGIEGLDYLKKIEDIDILYDLGVKSVNPVWNNHNQFGTGVRPCKIINKEKGLTQLGKKLINKLIKTGIAIDVSHSDEETFWDIIEICKIHKNLKPKIFASHSNCKTICNVPRNLSNEQIKAIKEFNGIIGIVEIKNFCSKNYNVNIKQKYIQNINYIKHILGNVNNIALATDDMSYYKIDSEYYKNMNVFKQTEADKEITELLKINNYTEVEIEQIKNKNFEKFFNIK